MKSNQKLSEEDINKIAVQHQQMQYQAQALIQQINLVDVSIDECQKAINTITEFEGLEDGHEILVPIGYGTNVRANLAKPDNVIIEVGADISVEKNLDDARESLKTRKEELTKYQNNLQTNLNELVTKMREIEAVLSVAAGKMQKQQNATQGS